MKVLSRKVCKTPHLTANFIFRILISIQYFQTLKNHIYWRKLQKYKTAASHSLWKKKRKTQIWVHVCFLQSNLVFSMWRFISIPLSQFTHKNFNSLWRQQSVFTAMLPQGILSDIWNFRRERRGRDVLQRTGWKICKFQIKQVRMEISTLLKPQEIW